MEIAPNYAPGLRMAASQLREKAAQVQAVTARLDSQLASMSYAGPSADRFRANAAGYRRELLLVRDRLSGSADILTRSAASYEAAAGNPAI